MIFSTKQTARNLILSLFSLLLLVSCNSALQITGTDISNMYSGEKENLLQINYVYNLNDSFSTLRIILPAGLISPEPRNSGHSKNGKLKLEILSAGKHSNLIDSTTFSIADTLGTSDLISQTWVFKAPSGNDYMIRATYTVPGSSDDLILLEYLRKKNHMDRSWYRFQSESGEYLPGYITAYPQPLRIVTVDTITQKLHVEYFAHNFPAPQPPFSKADRESFNYLPDSTFTLELRNGYTPYFTPENTGFYFFQCDSNTKQGPTLFRMSNGFPKITMHTQMLEALQYITSAWEFHHLNSCPIPKMAVDSFWIAAAGRSDLATELIRKYYSHIETANSLFTSFTEGWKTDRGMIYSVMGKPSEVYRSPENEIWIYGEYDDPRSLEFYFVKSDNPFTDNDYILVRSLMYQTIWYQNVQLWRR